MSAENKVPAIRFQGFSGELNRISLNNATSVFRSGKFLKAEDIKKQDIYPVYGGNGLRGYTADYNHNGTYALIGRQGALCGNMNLSHGKAFFTEHAIAVQANQENDTVFLYYKLGLMDLGQYSGQSAQPGLAVNKLIELEISAPVKSEQSAIGNYFQKLDRLINQHQQKHDKLSNLKKAMLEKMFPKPGKTTPEIRFKGFSGEWATDVLGKVVSFYKGKGLPKSAMQEDGIYSCIHYGELFTEYSEIIELIKSRTNQSDNFLSVSNDVLMPTSDVTPNGLVKPCCIKQSGVVLGGDILIIRPNDKNMLDGAFLSRFIRSREQQVLRNVTGSTVFHLYASSIEDLDIVFPSIEEQTTIGNYFQKLDQLITQHQEQISKLNNIKQACLSKMFV